MQEDDQLNFDHFSVGKNKNGKWDVLGRGGMGITYRAYDTKLRRTVALKVINPSLLDEDDAYKMFLREARAAANLSHRNVAQIYQVGSEEEKVYYAMEFIEGETIDQLVKRRQAEGHPGLELGQALTICLQTVQALLAAETKNLVHRDIKPSNIMATSEDDGELLIKLIDFGLAKSLQNKGEHSVFESRPGFMGTPTYASPEQITDQPIDIRADFYSLGATLWYMLTGRPPFISDNPFELYTKHLNEAVPSQRLHDINIPACVIEIIEDMLEKKPTDRPQNARILLDRFRNCMSQLNLAGTFHGMTTRRPADEDAYPEKPDTLATRMASPDGCPPTEIAPTSYGTLTPGTKSSAPIAITALIIAMALAGGVWWYINRDRPNEASTTTPSRSVAITNPETGGPAAGQNAPPRSENASTSLSGSAATTLASANALRTEQQWADAITGYLHVRDTYPDTAEALSAKVSIDTIIDEILTDPSPSRLTALQPVREDLRNLAEDGSKPAAQLAEMLYRKDDPATSARLLSILQDAGPAGTNDAQTVRMKTDTPPLNNQSTDPRDPDPPTLPDKTIVDPNDPRVLARYQENANRLKSEAKWSEAVALFLQIREELPSGHDYAELELNQLFNRWSAPENQDVSLLEQQRLKPHLETAAGAGFPSAMLVLARFSKEPEKRAQWHKQALDLYMDQQQYAPALSLALRMKQGDPNDQRYADESLKQLIDIFGPKGSAVTDTDFNKYRTTLETIARLPHLPTAELLANRWSSTDPNQSFKWYEFIAQQPAATPESQQLVGHMLEEGVGTRKDTKQAVSWYQKAADQFEQSGRSADLLNALVSIYRVAPTSSASFAAQKKIAAMLDYFAKEATGYGIAEFAKAEPYVEELAQLGYNQAMEVLGTKLIRTNPQKAEQWLSKAAQGHVDNGYWPEAVETYTVIAQTFPDRKQSAIDTMETFLGKLDPQSNLTSTDLAELAPSLEEAATLPVISAMSLLWMYYKDADPEQSAEWLTKAAQGGDSHAMLQLGLHYSNGNGLEQDFEKAFAWIKKAYESNNVESGLALADCYLRGLGTEQNPKEGIRLLQISIDANDARAMNMLGGYYKTTAAGENATYDKATDLFQRAANLNHPAAFSSLGIMHGAGHGSLEPNPSKAVSIWKMGVEKGDIPSMYYYGNVIYSGEYKGVEQNEKEGLKNIRRAAEAGFSPAQAWLQERGLGNK